MADNSQNTIFEAFVSAYNWEQCDRYYCLTVRGQTAPTLKLNIVVAVITVGPKCKSYFILMYRHVGAKLFEATTK